MKKIKDCQIEKAITCEKEDSIMKVAKILANNNSKHIIVVDKQKPIGIISVTDINSKLVAKGKSSRTTKAKEIMSKKLLSKETKDNLNDIYKEMIERKIYSIPITEKGVLKGTINLRLLIDYLK